MALSRRYTTLLVEDDVPMRTLLRRALETAGRFEITGEAGDGLAAIERAQVLRPDLIMLDLMMPIMNGFQALPALLRVSPASRVIVLSMLHGNPIQRECLQLGASAFVDKMVSDDELVREVLSVLEPREGDPRERRPQLPTEPEPAPTAQ